VSRIPLRLRLTLAFALVMAVVLAATGAFLYLRLQASLGESIDENLRLRAADVAALVLRDETALETRGFGGDDDEGLAQLIDGEGAVLGATTPRVAARLLDREQLAQVDEDGTFVVRPALDGDEDWRLLIRPAVVTSGFPSRGFVVVGASLDDRDEALGSLLAQLLVGLPLALAVASLAGYGVASAALRPVEAMRGRAAAISGDSAGARLPVPLARDEIRRLGETLNGMLARVEAARERERSFVADASHELRTPLALLKAELELALRRPREAAELERAVRSAADEADRLAQLAEDLLVLARADEGRLPLRRERLRVRGVLDGVRERYARRAADAGRRLAVRAPAGLEVDGDRLRLEQALGNLVDNALRHGGGAIELAARADEGRTHIGITDDGRGFPADFLPNAFARFTRSDEARAGGGAGLGLAIVEVVAAAHGGTVRAANRPGGGAEVWLALPPG
jgi:heavy metal sensor kinase